jgi:hypothetical protein
MVLYPREPTPHNKVKSGKAKGLNGRGRGDQRCMPPTPQQPLKPIGEGPPHRCLTVLIMLIL